ncbi:MAG: vitamin K epoxide reductase family protein [Kaiparowitsia implicata GSE-PSE-MK54-09C]|jgi:uncharacterized membrane protein/glutaredoxin|nr:vitamin K epoxide reductase family protein [Kaiparowitsia implicata GSE-PSE-MK54-09C]
MARRRSTPWLHRKSRYIIGAIATVGAINTAYLTTTKLLGGTAACPTTGCEQVLSSPYAEFLGLPLALFGFLAYVAMAAFALGPLVVSADRNKSLRTTLDNNTWLLLLAGSTAMLIFSLYLMYIMVSQFVSVFGAQGVCVFCIASALFALGMFVFTLLGRDWDDIGQVLFIGIIVAMITLIGSLAWTASIAGPTASTNGSTVSGNTVPPITTPSGPSEVALAEHLRDTGAVMYGAYWCPHCHDQKQLFGAEAATAFPYVECAADGANAQPAVCQAKGIQGYPTWEINGELYSGTQSLNQLAQASGYQGSLGFRN